ncbi:hypothetical protein CTA2_1202 [Colletotrichum tanaceti]|uniref:Uncharacterized protein n=1 Tax=Colletotrichum tanaceti TaxID=1306861 RepID=A0A4U6XJ68_9PEZI|nr:hypothetical protein CTA2_1202 [Colletotrichum tanaceti]TKW55945.1 hypothetical protein CTA1_8425 [Colletotrichum tanaceti]
MEVGSARLYLVLVPGALIISAGIGHDSSMMDGIQSYFRTLVSYYLAPVLRSIGKTLVNGIIQIWNPVIFMVGANLVQRVGGWSLFLATLVGVISWIVSGSAPLAIAYRVEILLFPIRAKGVALLMGSINDASFFGQFVHSIIQACESLMRKYGRRRW